MIYQVIRLIYVSSFRLVHVVSNSRGQNARIGKELERMVGEVGGAEIVQSNASNVTCVKLLKCKRSVFYSPFFQKI